MSTSNYTPHSYPFNQREIRHDPLNHFELQKNILFSDKETLKTDSRATIPMPKETLCVYANVLPVSSNVSLNAASNVYTSCYTVYPASNE